MPDHRFHRDSGPHEALVAYGMFVRGSKHQPNLNPGGCGGESTARNCRKQLRKRAADSKHGFERRLTFTSKVRSELDPVPALRKIQSDSHIPTVFPDDSQRIPIEFTCIDVNERPLGQVEMGSATLSFLKSFPPGDSHNYSTTPEGRRSFSVYRIRRAPRKRVSG